jgi:hypothetical protein
MKQVSAYQTSDGKVFVSEPDAEQHEATIANGVSRRACQDLADNWRRIAHDVNTSRDEARTLRGCAVDLINSLGK